jgi:hypothetical protein
VTDPYVWTQIYFDPNERHWVVALYIANPIPGTDPYHYPAVRCDRDTGPTRESVEPKGEAMLKAAKEGRYSNDAARTLGIIAP